VLIERGGPGFIESGLDAVRFVPMEAGKARRGRRQDWHASWSWR